MPTLTRARLGRVDAVHVLAFAIGHHLEGHLVVVPQEDRPLTRRWDLRRLTHDVDDGVAILLGDRHEHPGHEREVEGHVTFVAVAEILTHVLGPLVRFGQEDFVFVFVVEHRPHDLDDPVRFGQILVRGTLAFAQVRDGIEAQPIDAGIEPIAHHVHDRLDHARIVVVEIGLVREEAVPVVLAGNRIPRPVRRFGVGEDNASARILLVRVAPDVEVAPDGSFLGVTGPLEPRVLVRGVIDDEFDQDPDAAVVRRFDERAEVVHRAEGGVDVAVVRDVVTVVAHR